MPITSNASGIKAGTVAMFAASTAPAGWIKANGATVSRTAYAALFLAIGTTYGAGDGATTFKVPDCRGEFLRCLDDGRGVDSGRGIGTLQSQEYQAHAHLESIAFTIGAADLDLFKASYAGASGKSAGFAGAYYSNQTRGVTADSGASETRPRNVAMLACIKY